MCIFNKRWHERSSCHVLRNVPECNFLIHVTHQHHFFFLVSTCDCGHLPVLSSDSHPYCNMTHHAKIKHTLRLLSSWLLPWTLEITNKHMKICIVVWLSLSCEVCGWSSESRWKQQVLNDLICAANFNKFNPNLLNNFRNQHSPK